ncbi:MAG: uroporphyrinogen decarboxylase family protein [Treponema sp.]|jgi:uroporphyrinogen decarboxylase|nr:uroporphyrinogen decarboxylase family protein [Treponema sp.]
MTGYERIMAALNRQKPDKVPLMLLAASPVATESGFTMEQYRSSAKNMAKANIAFARKYGLDGILLEVDTCVLAGAVGVPVDLPEDDPARVIGPASNDINELMDLMEPGRLYTNDRVNIIIEACGLIKKETGNEFLLRGNCDQMAYSLAMLAYGMMDFFTDLTDEEQGEKILKLIEKALYVHLEYHKMMKAAGADITSFGDSSCGPDLISREMFLKYSLPFHKKLHEELQKLNIKAVCHICGNLDLILEDVASIGHEGVEIDYKTDMNRAAPAMKGKSTVFGPIDPSGLFYFGTPEKMRLEVKRVLDCFGGRGIVLGAGCAIPKGAPEANIRAFVNAAREYTIQ